MKFNVNRLNLMPLGRARFFARAHRVLLALLIPLFCSAPTHSQNAGKNPGYIEAKKKAKAAYRAGRFSDAAEQFKQAFEFSPRGNLLYNIGLCYEKAGQIDDAIRFYQRFIDAVPESNKRALLQTKISKLKARLGDRYRTVEVTTDPPGAFIYVDDRASGSMGKSPVSFRLLPGNYTVIADLKDHEPVKQKIEVRNSGRNRTQLALVPSAEYSNTRIMVSERGADVMIDRKRIGKSPIIDVKRLKLGAHQVVVMKPGFRNWSETVQIKAQPLNRIDVQLQVEGVPQVEIDYETPAKNPWPWVTMGVGVAALAGGAVTGFMAKGLHSKLDEKRDRSELIAPADIEAGNSLVFTTNVLLSLGTVAVAGGLTWWFLDARGVERNESITTFFIPQPDGGHVGLGGRF